MPLRGSTYSGDKSRNQIREHLWRLSAHPDLASLLPPFDSPLLSADGEQIAGGRIRRTPLTSITDVPRFSVSSELFLGSASVETDVGSLKRTFRGNGCCSGICCCGCCCCCCESCTSGCLAILLVVVLLLLILQRQRRSTCRKLQGAKARVRIHQGASKQGKKKEAVERIRKPAHREANDENDTSQKRISTYVAR